MTSETPTPKPFFVLVADDQAVVRHGVRALLESQAGVEVCCEAANGVEALDHVKKTKTDLVVLDMTVPEMNGLEAARAIREASPETEVLSLSIHFSEEIARVASRRGARLRAEIRRKLGTNCGGPALATGQTVFYEAARHLHGRLLRPRSLRLKHRRIAAWSAAHDPEVEIVRLLANGKSNKEAAAMLDVSTRTIENHREHIMHKMEFTSFSDLIRFAVRNNLVEP